MRYDCSVQSEPISELCQKLFLCKINNTILCWHWLLFLPLLLLLLLLMVAGVVSQHFVSGGFIISTQLIGFNSNNKQQPFWQQTEHFLSAQRQIFIQMNFFFHESNFYSCVTIDWLSVIGCQPVLGAYCPRTDEVGSSNPCEEKRIREWTDGLLIVSKRCFNAWPPLLKNTYSISTSENMLGILFVKYLAMMFCIVSWHIKPLNCLQR